MIDYSALMRQASMTAHVYLDEAINRIDNELGEGYAKKHPELIGVFMQVCVADYTTGVEAKQKEAY